LKIGHQEYGGNVLLTFANDPFLAPSCVSLLEVKRLPSILPKML